MGLYYIGNPASKSREIRESFICAHNLMALHGAVYAKMASSAAGSQPITDKNELVSVTLYPASQESGYQDIIAAALSAAFDETVVTKQEYDRRKDQPEFGNAERLDIRRYEKMCYESVKIQFEHPIAVTVIVKNLPEQPSYELSVGDKSYVKELKYRFEEKLGIPVDHSRLFFTFKGQQLEDGCRLSDYGPVRHIV
jgi:hypothetical protein